MDLLRKVPLGALFSLLLAGVVVAGGREGMVPVVSGTTGLTGTGPENTLYSIDCTKIYQVVTPTATSPTPISLSFTWPAQDEEGDPPMPSANPPYIYRWKIDYYNSLTSAGGPTTIKDPTGIEYTNLYDPNHPNDLHPKANLDVTLVQATATTAAYYVAKPSISSPVDLIKPTGAGYIAIGIEIHHDPNGGSVHWDTDPRDEIGITTATLPSHPQLRQSMLPSPSFSKTKRSHSHPHRHHRQRRHHHRIHRRPKRRLSNHITKQNHINKTKVKK